MAMASMVSKLARAAFATRASPGAAIPTVVSPAGGPKYAAMLGDRIQIHPDGNVFKSKEAMWALYEKWSKFHGKVSDSSEMKRRFKTFSETARRVYESGGLMHMSQYADMTMEERSRLHSCRCRPPRVRVN